MPVMDDLIHFIQDQLIEFQPRDNYPELLQLSSVISLRRAQRRQGLLGSQNVSLGMLDSKTDLHVLHPTLTT